VPPVSSCMKASGNGAVHDSETRIWCRAQQLNSVLLVVECCVPPVCRRSMECDVRFRADESNTYSKVEPCQECFSLYQAKLLFQ